jgi:hypothetical protein
MPLKEFITNKKPLVMGLCLVVIVLSAWSVKRTLTARGQPAGRDYFNALGEVSAQEAARFLDGRGNVVLVVFDASASPHINMQQSAFEKRLVEEGLTVLGKVEIDIGGDFDALMRGSADLVPDDLFAEAFTLKPGADAVVSLVGLPRGKQAVDELNVEKRPPLILMREWNGPGESVLAMLKEGGIDMAILPRPVDSSAAKRHPRSDREWFNLRFQVVSPDNVDEYSF